MCTVFTANLATETGEVGLDGAHARAGRHETREDAVTDARKVKRLRCLANEMQPRFVCEILKSYLGCFSLLGSNRDR